MTARDWRTQLLVLAGRKEAENIGVYREPNFQGKDGQNCGIVPIIVFNRYVGCAHQWYTKGLLRLWCLRCLLSFRLFSNGLQMLICISPSVLSWYCRISYILQLIEVVIVIHFIVRIAICTSVSTKIPPSWWNGTVPHTLRSPEQIKDLWGCGTNLLLKNMPIKIAQVGTIWSIDPGNVSQSAFFFFGAVVLIPEFPHAQ